MKVLLTSLMVSQLLFYSAVSFATQDLSWPVTRAPEWTSMQRFDLILGLILFTTIFVGLVYYLYDPRSKYKKFH